MHEAQEKKSAGTVRQTGSVPAEVPRGVNAIPAPRGVWWRDGRRNRHRGEQNWHGELPSGEPSRSHAASAGTERKVARSISMPASFAASISDCQCSWGMRPRSFQPCTVETGKSRSSVDNARAVLVRPPSLLIMNSAGEMAFTIRIHVSLQWRHTQHA